MPLFGIKKENGEYFDAGFEGCILLFNSKKMAMQMALAEKLDGPIKLTTHDLRKPVKEEGLG